MNDAPIYGIPYILLIAAILTGCSGGGETESSNAPTQTASSSPSAGVDPSNPCTLLTPEQAASAVGLKLVMREIVESNVCTLEYEVPVQTSSPALSTNPDGAKSSGSGSDEQQAEEMAKAFTVGATGGSPKVTYTIHWEDGETVVAGVRMAGQLMGADSMTKLDGIGDEAWLGAMASMLYVRKGDVGLEIDLRLMPDGKERGTRLAQAMVSRLK